VLLRRYMQVCILSGLLASEAVCAPAPAQLPKPSPSFSFATVQRLARERASRPYKAASARLPGELANLSYDQYRDIRFKRENALWHRQALFEVQLFHRGFNFARKVNVAEVSGGKVLPVAYNPLLFNFGKLKISAKLPANLGFAGLRVHYPLHTPAYKDELIVFLGASYFRVLGRGQNYGISARGLAVDTATERGEEFPYFTDFWLERPAREQRTLRMYALLDSPGVAGAYCFDIRPGAITQVEVLSELYPRHEITKLGIAPLTSMFLYGEDKTSRSFDDFRPEVHDSDGLLANTGAGEWLWRPLGNPRALRVNRFTDTNPRGFGLSQRDRNFANYQDNEARYHLRPSYWIEPLGQWGPGGVELVEIPTDEEIHDNIVAYWVPKAPVQPGKPLRFTYLLNAYSYSPNWPPGGRAVATRTGDAATGGSRSDGEGRRRILVDFAGGDLAGLHASQPVRARIVAKGGSIDDVTIQRLPDSTGTWRASFRVAPKRAEVELRCYLTLYGEALTETWTYQWTR